MQQRLLSVPSSLSSCAREEVLAAVQRLINKGYLRRVVSATDGAALYQGGIAYVPASSSTLSTAAVREEQEHRRVSPPAQGPFSPSPLFGACMAAEARGDGSAGWIGNGEDRHEQLEAALGLLRRRVEAVTGVLHVDASTASTLLGRATPAWDVGPVVGAFVDGEGGEDPLTALLHAHNLPSLLVSDGVRRGVRVLVEAADEQEKELCPCCLSEPVAVRFARCGHGACRECVARMASADMEEGRLPLSCLALVEEEGTGAGAGSRPDPRRMHRCPSALTPAALVEAGMGEGEVLLWGFEIPARDRVGSGAAAYCERVVVSAVCAVAEKLEIVAALVAEGREEELVQLQLTTGALDYAVSEYVVGLKGALCQRACFLFDFWHTHTHETHD